MWMFLNKQHRLPLWGQSFFEYWLDEVIRVVLLAPALILACNLAGSTLCYNKVAVECTAGETYAVGVVNTYVNYNTLFLA